MILVKPFKEKKLLYLEAFNEACILCISYSLFLFTDYLPDDPDFQYQIGNLAKNANLEIVRTLMYFHGKKKDQKVEFKEIKYLIQQGALKRLITLVLLGIR
ncbi:UNKNOWN [Stylonychia lemnae]|uniref:Uncharacterized protein n=1 Tax=Stylonychia lemnae TaxID=5949 RepID=A0A078A3J0_STYLE|nr:UNKNOWN [Stylonychia lemnae]|eukprot:CDW76367.1 UNKNOWN [Stylonychia lemnae]